MDKKRYVQDKHVQTPGREGEEKEEEESRKLGENGYLLNSGALK